MATSTAVPTPSLIVGLRLNSKRAAVFGSGQSAASRAVFALDAGADVVIYGGNVAEQLGKWIDNGRVSVVPTGKYSSSDLAGFSVVFVTDAALAQTVAQDAHAIGIPVNVAGDSEFSDFSLLPTYRGSSSLQVAVTTNGVAPRVASQLLKEIVSKLPEGLDGQLKEVAQLNYLAQETERKRAAALAKLDFGSKAVVSPATPQDISTAVTAAQTPVHPLSSPGSVAEAAVADLAALSASGAPQTIDVQAASSYVAYALSDLCFVYAAREQELGEAALAWSRQAEKNAYGEWVSALRMQTRQGAGHALWGSLAAGSRVSAVAAAPSLPYMLPVLAELTAQKQPVVLHVAAQSLDDQADVQTDFSDAFVALQSGAVFLASASAQEAHDMALIAHAVAQAAGTPVVHLTNGAAEAAEAAAVSVASFAQLTGFVAAVSAAAPANAAAAVAAAFTQFAQTFGRTYQSFEYTGSASASTVVVAIGSTASTVQAALPALVKEADVGLLTVRALRPWDAQALFAQLPQTAARVVVLRDAQDDISPDALFSDIATGAFLARPAAPVRATSVNVYGKASADVIATVREALGLEPLAVAETEVEVVSAEEAAAPAEAGEVSLADTEPQAYVDSPLAIAQRLAFPEAFATAVTARPGEKTFTVKVSSKYRMTPDSYDRNIIHIEFDARGTGLTYEIGDALGVFGYNDASQVSDFCAQYGLDQSQYVTALKDGQSQTRSVHSWLTHALDLFGRPSKKFYAALADFATDTAQADKLRWLTTSEGAVEFKDRVADTVTYADLLLEFGSARPSILHLVDMIPAIKPRHYSIASSAKMHPGYVHLCVVIV
ncbi:sulfite reductase [NADPH] flavoprotein component, partial [Linderina pennispora]